MDLHRRNYYKKKKKYLIVVMFLIMIIAALMYIGLSYGKTIYSFSHIYNVLFHGETEGAFVITTLRLPRVIIGLLAGICFGLAGNIFQKLLRNPLASPDMIGISTGASVAAVFAILILQLSGLIVSLIAIIFGMLISLLIVLLSYHHGYSNNRLILIGIGMRAMLSAMISWMLIRTSEYDVGNALRWLSGSLNTVNMNDAFSLLIVTIIACVLIAIMNNGLSVMGLGEELPVSLGVNTKTLRISLVIVGLMLVAFATSITGPIASVSFLSGPIAGRILRNGKNNMAATACIGAILVLASDLIAQYGLSSRYPVGVVTGMLGAPYLLYLIFMMNKKGVQ
ncbi:iron complex transport system permease protein [Kandleria vitulina]|jgi:iron complex transport system permease protein|uniref:FecCD family ABC transporter permease n=1 Tax=Kandleria vitulina TaxID=1630 RepID=UPI00088DCDBE|nr:iron ABC transporter permease [Kandleria vitulina]MEE0988199.1 iron ABC transporter permease [Kandleria vitulina]SDL81511.1 iron complex transport system permease protein [Kandleria vitulina]HAD23451.1 iron ABC transporter permease [Kandleria vitulina]